MQLGLGTAQFGLDYGVSNREGRTSPEEVARILAYAGQKGVRMLDTAAGYGESEAVLGDVLGPGNAFRIITKTPRFDVAVITSGEASALQAACNRSLSRLRQERLYGLLIHAVDELLRPGGELLWRSMAALQREGLVEKIGVSVYRGSEIDAVLDRFHPDLVQAPVNVLDQRLVASGHLSRVKALQIEVHARSAFLQGLLLMNGAPLPPYFSDFHPELDKVREYCRRHAVEPLQMALDFVKSIAEIDAVIVGVASLDQLMQVVSAFDRTQTRRGDYAALACDDERLVNPAQWRL